MKRILQGLAVAALLVAAPPAMAQSVEARLQTLEDQEQIRELVVNDYSRALDLMDMHSYASLFTADGELSIGGLVVKGPENIAKMFAPPPPGAPPMALPPPPPGVLPMPAPDGPSRPRQVPHVITNTSYKVDGNTAEGISYWMEIMLIEGRPGIVNMGHYEDKLRKVDGHWKFAKRTIVRDVPLGTSILPASGTP